MKMTAPAHDALSGPLEFSGGTLIDRLLAEQQSLTAVDRFSQKHARADFPLQAKYYRDLIPLSKPGPGQQYAFEVNLDSCSGCKACVSACHSLNGLEENETWRDVGLVIGKEKGRAYQQTVTTACHHCQEPGCLEGCPVGAYEKEAGTGIVRHLDDQCIGCQYCAMKCPYDVPKYSSRLGIVRKCDMCRDRLAVGEAPACVQACPHEAIKITLVDVEQVIRDAVPGSTMLPGAFDSSYTLPTTRYLSRKNIPAASTPANAHKLRLEHPHWPLIVMLILTQTAAGMFATLAVVGVFYPASLKMIQFPASAFAFFLLNAGLGGATLHLGRPLGAWRFFLGLRTSWMSREILVFSIFAAVAASATAAAWFLPGSMIALEATAGAAILGVGAVFTSVMIYVDTHREFWKGKYTFPKFYGTAALLGLIATGVIGAWTGCFFSTDSSDLTRGVASVALILLGWLVLWEFSRYREALDDDASPIHQSALIIERLLPKLKATRDILCVLSGLFLFGATLTGGMPAAFFLSLAFISIGVFFLLERYTFFTAVVAYRMPGGI
jgi:formate dehydrogenase iron-sulfur subunit